MDPGNLTVLRKHCRESRDFTDYEARGLPSGEELAIPEPVRDNSGRSLIISGISPGPCPDPGQVDTVPGDRTSFNLFRKRII